jgi:hypothetical protein
MLNSNSNFTNLLNKEPGLEFYGNSVQLMVKRGLKKWYILLLFLVLGLIVAKYIDFRYPTRYQAITILSLQDEKLRSQVSSGSFGVNPQPEQVLKPEESSELLVEMLNSKLTIRNVLKDMSVKNPSLLFELFRQYYISYPPLGVKMELKDSVLFPKEYNELIENVVDFISLNCLKVERLDGKSNLIKTSYTCINPVFAKNFSEQLVQYTITYYINLRTKKISNLVANITYQIDSVKYLMNSNLDSSSQENDNFAASVLKPSLAKDEQKYKNQYELFKTIYDDLNRNLSQANIVLMDKTPIVDIVDQPFLPLKKTGFYGYKLYLICSIVAILIGLLFISFTPSKL